MKKIITAFLITLSALVVNAQPVIDGTFDGAGVWGAPVATADGIAGWVGVNAQNLYVTYDANYMYLAASLTGAAGWQSFCFVISTKAGGATQDSWSRQVFYDYFNNPDYDIRGNLNNAWAEIHTWTGAAWTGAGVNIGTTEYRVAADLSYIEARIPFATLENPLLGDVQFYITGNNNDHGCFDAIPNDQNSTGWSPPTSSSLLENILTNIALPVELKSFSGIAKSGKVVLNWATATETNNKGFEIEKSSNNVNWQNIGFVEGNGNSNSTKNYSFIDNNFTEKSYYRLVQVNIDGTSKTYDAIEVANNLPTVFALNQNYPNPFNPSTVISYSVPVSSNINLKVYDVLGNEVKELVNETKEAGSYKVNFDASGLNSGVYFYTLKANGFTSTNKMLLVK